MPRNDKRIAEANITTVLHLWKRKYTVAEIARVINMSTSGVYKILKVELIKKKGK
jgi:predicted transcriptional regulator